MPVDQAGSNGEEFDQFFRAQHPRLVAIALALTGDIELARDAAQDALLRAFRDWSRVAALDHPAAWVRKVVVNAAIDGRRRRDRDRRLTTRLAGSVSTGAWSPASSAAWSLPEMSSTWQAVRALPERQRAAVVLRYVDDLSVAEIADVLGVAEGTVKASLHKARASLEVRLNEQES